MSGEVPSQLQQPDRSAPQAQHAQAERGGIAQNIVAAGNPAFRVIQGFWRHAPNEIAGQRAGAW